MSVCGHNLCLRAATGDAVHTYLISQIWIECNPFTICMPKNSCALLSHCERVFVSELEDAALILKRSVDCTCTDGPTQLMKIYAQFTAG